MEKPTRILAMFIAAPYFLLLYHNPAKASLLFGLTEVEETIASYLSFGDFPPLPEASLTNLRFQGEIAASK
jgi:hypothetical protein